MKRLMSLMIVVGILAGCAVTKTADSGGRWNCSAQNIKQFSYDGGEYAFIQLAQYETGGTYPVKRTGDIASGLTKNNTPFECRLSK